MARVQDEQGRVIRCRTAVVGAGPAGLMCAIRAAEGGSAVVIEKNKSAGRKLLISGSGQCNFTHDGEIDGFLGHYGKNGRFLKPALYDFSNMDLVGFLGERGLGAVKDKNGKLFPATLYSRDVLDLLVRECGRAGVKILFGAPAVKIVKGGDGFALTAGRALIKSEFLVLATGGKSYPGTGSTGDGYAFASGLGHAIIEPAPALAPVIVRDHGLGKLSGLSFSGSWIELWRDGRRVMSAAGDFQITHRGLSGPVILDSSRYMRKGDTIRACLAGSGNAESRRSDLSAGFRKGGPGTVKGVIAGALPARLAAAVLEEAGVPASMKLSGLKGDSRERIIELATGFPFTIECLGGYDEAMVTRGGVCLDEVNRKTMESRIVKNLFFAGEVLDVDGDTGGYNIQAAFSTGALAGKTIASRE